MRTFVRVSQAKSFVDAAKQLGMTKSAVSRQVSKLESLLGVSLIQRSTRVLSLTQSGQTYLKDCLSLLDALDAAEERARADVSKASGILRLGAPLSIGTRQLPLLLATFHEEFPDISVELTMLTRTLDLAKAGQGILFLPTYLVGDELGRGTLVPLFPQWRPYRQDIHAVRMSGSHMPARARLLINFMMKHWGTNPPWDRWLELNRQP